MLLRRFAHQVISPAIYKKTLASNSVEWRDPDLSNSGDQRRTESRDWTVPKKFQQAPTVFHQATELLELRSYPRQAEPVCVSTRRSGRPTISAHRRSPPHAHGPSAES